MIRSLIHQLTSLLELYSGIYLLQRPDTDLEIFLSVLENGSDDDDREVDCENSEKSLTYKSNETKSLNTSHETDSVESPRWHQSASWNGFHDNLCDGEQVDLPNTDIDSFTNVTSP